jgi:hypothetical protein
LVAAWKRSGLPAREFGAKHGVLGERLSWWRWYLGSRKPVVGSGVAGDLRLVPIRVTEEPTPKEANGLGVAWELTTASGHVLRVDHISAAEVKLVIKALLAGRGRR